MVIRNLKLQQLFTFVGIVLFSALGFVVALVLNGLTYLLGAIGMRSSISRFYSWSLVPITVPFLA